MIRNLLRSDKAGDDGSVMPLLTEKTIAGLHDFVIKEALQPFSPSGGRAIDLGAGSGALALRLRSLGWDVQAADINASQYQADVPFVRVDLNEPDFAARLGERAFSLVTSVEVIEHVESPIGFLRNVARLLRPNGIALITTPNVDNIPARLKFLLRGCIRMLDQLSYPTKISQIFWDLLTRLYLPQGGLRLVTHLLYPPRGHKVTRKRYTWIFRPLALLLAGDSLSGDNHVMALRLAQPS